MGVHSPRQQEAAAFGRGRMSLVRAGYRPTWALDRRPRPRALAAGLPSWPYLVRSETLGGYMKKHDRFGGLFWFILGAIICIMSVKLRIGTLYKPGPGFTPFLSGAVLVVSGLILMLSTFLKQYMDEEMGSILVKEGRKNSLLTLLALFGYIVLLEPIGFLITTFIVLLFLFKITDTKRWLAPVVLSGSSVIVSYLVFSVWLKLQFPKGLFGF
jgi:putative tricarboxylic transport membrane protein